MLALTHRPSHLILGIVAVSCTSSALLAQSAVTNDLFGVVRDRSGASIPGAKLTLVYESSGASRTQTASAEGSFSFIRLTAGRYKLRVEAPGFAPREQTVSYEGAPIQIGVTLAAGANTEVTVSASDTLEGDPTEPAHVYITPQEIERMPSQSVSSPFSSLVTMTTPGVSADSNGSFHPLGDHAEASFFVDGLPITDQQSRTFSTQVSLNTLQSVEVREGAPGADVGDKTSMVIIAQTRSGLDQRKPHGTVQLSRGSFATSNSSATLGVGSEHIGSFSAIDGVNSARFLDAPETINLHANGNAENAFERLDFRLSDKTVAQLNLGFSHSWFQTPNTFDQEALGQNQRQTIVSFNVAPQLVHTFSDHAFNRTNLWVRQDKVRYRPSSNLFSDTPAYLSQGRRLTSTGIRDAFSYNRGRHNLIAGFEFKHTFLAEEFATGLTDSTYNSPCLGSDGAPSSNTVARDPSQCAALGLSANDDFLPGLLAIDLTRGGSIYSFQGKTDIKQESPFVQDFVKFGNVTLDLGFRYDQYNGLVANHGVQPRVGVIYAPQPLKTSFHLNYSRVFITPYNENLIVASSNGPGSVSAALGASNSAVLNTGHRNQFNVGFDTTLRRVNFSGEYLWKFTYGAYDFDVLLNSPLTFPTQFRKSKIDGGLIRATLTPMHGFNGFITVSHVRSRLFGPELGGISYSAPYSDVARPDHDEGLAMNVNARYQFGHRGPWFNSSYRYDGGLVAVAVPDVQTALQLTGDEQQQMGLHCDSTFATVASPLRACSGSISATRIRIPPAGTENDDHNPPRIAVRNTVDMSAGMDNLLHTEHQSLGFRVDAVNVNNPQALYNFLSTFSGTHFLSPRSVTVGLRYGF